jgi:hypothetical protein
MYDFDFEHTNAIDEYGYKQYRHHKVVDVNTRYKINTNGFRGNEISGDEDLVIGGCSFTFGLGIPENKIWAVELSNGLNLKYTNLSYPGASTMFIVQLMFKYFKKYGNPKTIICLFPDAYRMCLPYVKNKLKSLDNPTNEEISHLFLKGFTDNRIPAYSKLPHMAEHVIPKDVAKWLSIQHIYMLEQYCKSNNIKFIWSSWEDVFLKELLELNTFNGLIDIEMNKWIRNKDEHYDMYEKNDCHLNLKNEYSNIFDRGADLEWGVQHSHWGVHKHAHISEIFQKELSK